MRGAGHAIQLVQVIGDHPRVDQSPAQFGKRVNAIVHTTQQDGLIQNGDARVDQARQRRDNRPVELGRMVGVYHNDRDQPCSTEPRD